MLDTLVVSDSLSKSDSILRACLHMGSGLYDLPSLYPATCTEMVSDTITRTFLGMPLEVATFVVPTIATLIVFALGYFISAVIKWHNKKKENQRYRECIFEWVKLLDKPIQKQIDSLRDLARRITSSDTLQPEAFIWSKSLVDKLNDISANNMLSVFVLDSKDNVQNKGKETFNVVSQFDYLSSVDKIVMEKYDEYKECCIGLLKHWNDTFPKLKEHKENIVVFDSQVSLIANSFYSIWNRWVKIANSKEFSMEINSKYLIEPMLKEMSEVSLECPSSRLAKDILEDINELYLISQQWTKSKEGYSQVFNDLANTIDRSYKQLCISCDDLKN